MVASVLFIVADGARARLVVRSADNGDFITLREVDGRERLETLRRELRASPAGRSQESASPTRRSVGRTESVRQAKEAFVAEAAALAVAEHADHAQDGVVVVAPERLAAILQKNLEGRLKIVGVLAKDLTKVPNHALRSWLDPIHPHRSA
ncbi:host attachment protein [Caulobacter sp.]|uniref:host attachment protein n=1 Tax=Caulobacter sp. TaxID=78 RepID=UPI002B4A3A33|nr:host attachment protein [Caulobacter sp.]HJV43586.1 host attachment protein [Caulobacter sp.]